MEKRELWKVKHWTKDSFGADVFRTVWLVCDGLAGVHEALDGVVKARKVRDVEVVGNPDAELLVSVERARDLLAAADFSDADDADRVVEAMEVLNHLV